MSMCSWVCGCVCLCVRACCCEVREGCVCMCACVCSCVCVRIWVCITPPHTHRRAPTRRTKKTMGTVDSGCVTVKCLGEGGSVCVYVCLPVCVEGFVRMRVCGSVGVGVRFGTGLCAYVVGWPPHPHTHQHTDACSHVDTNRKSCIHPHANPTIHPYTNPHKSTHPTQRHTHTHVHMLHVAKVPAGVHWGGGTPGVRTNEGVHKGEICMNSREFT